MYIFEQLTVPETVTNMLLSLSNGVGVIDIASSVLYSGFLEGKWNPDLMTLMMEPTMFMIMALAEKAEIDYVLDSEDDVTVKEMSPEKQLQTLQGGINELDNIRKQAANRVNPQSVPAEIREVIEETKIPQSLLDKVKKEKSNSLLARGE
jgi:protoporphyrinogen oxidase